MRLQNKVAIITGAASGMGEAMAYTFAKEGAMVVATDIQEEKLNAIVDAIQKSGGKAIAVVHDVASRSDWFEKVLPQTLENFGTVDILINNAGISVPQAFMEQDETTWERTYGINVNSVMLGIQAVLPIMEQKGGSIVNVSSIAALTGMSGPGVYTASKGGVSAMTRAAAVDFGAKKIRVNAINPGYIMTPMSEIHLNKPKVKTYFESLIPLKDFGLAQDIADAALFLASDEAKYITGVNLAVDGGVTVK